MNEMWILANVEGNETSLGSIESETANKETETQSSTKVPSDPNANAAKSQPRGGFDTQQLLFFGLIFVVMYILLFRWPRKKQQDHKRMVQSLEKNDRVRTIGGIIGTVVDIKDDEITLKIDESNNTKIKVITSAIGKNLSKDKS